MAHHGFRNPHPRTGETLTLGVHNPRENVGAIERFHFENSRRLCSLFHADLLSIESAAPLNPSFRDAAAPAATSAAAVLIRTTSLLGPFSPLRMLSMMPAF